MIAVIFYPSFRAKKHRKLTLYFCLSRIIYLKFRECRCNYLQTQETVIQFTHMANLKNAKKALRKSQSNFDKNRRSKDRIHRWELKTAALIKEQNKDEANKSMTFLTKLIDKAAIRNVVSFNRAQRVKSRMQKKLNAV